MVFRILKPNFNNLFDIEGIKVPNWSKNIIIYGYYIVTH